MLTEKVSIKWKHMKIYVALSFMLHVHVDVTHRWLVS